LRPACGQRIGKQPPLLIKLGFIGALRQGENRQHDAAARYRQDYRDRDQLADP
jgi:xanthine dehydrogenase iron-sulfur cluster and FAD-binding subunit A